MPEHSPPKFSARRFSGSSTGRDRCPLEGSSMGLIFRRRIRAGRNSWLNLSGRGASLSRRSGPVTVNSRGRMTVRLGKGLSWRFKL